MITLKLQAIIRPTYTANLPSIRVYAKTGLLYTHTHKSW